MAEVVLESGKAKKRELWRWRLALGIATMLLALVTAFWTFWGVAELFYEGWWGHWYDRLVYLAPGAAFLALSLLVVKWPRLGGALLMLAGGAFGYLLLNIQIGRWGFRLLPVLQNLALTAPLWLGGLFFFVAGRRAAGAASRSGCACPRERLAIRPEPEIAPLPAPSLADVAGNRAPTGGCSGRYCG